MLKRVQTESVAYMAKRPRVLSPRCVLRLPLLCTLLFLVVLVLSGLVSAQAKSFVGSARGLAALRQALLDASSDTRVLVIATHPDDPYRALCLQLRSLWGCDVTVLVATRGEGGQNAVGPEQAEDLARIRTLEAVRAAAELGVQLRFLDFVDFGYSRSAAEALDVWRGDRAYEHLRANVLEVEPDLVITIHGTDETHGQKQAVVQLLTRLASEAPLPTTRYFRGVPADRSERPDIVLDYELADVSTGRSYRRDSYRILGLHATQGPRRKFDREFPPAKQGLRAIGSERAKSLFEGLPSLWDNEAILADVLRRASGMPARELRRSLEALPQGESVALASSSVMVRAFECLEAMRQLEELAAISTDAKRRLARRKSALERAIRIGSRVAIDWIGDGEAIHLDDGAAAIPLRIRNGGPYEVFVDAIELEAPRGGSLDGASGALRLASGMRGRASLTLRFAKGVELPARGRDVVLKLSLRVRLGAQGQVAKIRARLARRVLPPELVTLRPVPERRFLVPERGGKVRMSLEITKPVGRVVRAKLAMAGPPGVRFLPESDFDAMPIEIKLDARSRRLRVPLRVSVPRWVRKPAQPRVLRFYLSGEGLETAACEVAIHAVKIRLPVGLKIGLVRGPDTTIEDSLASLGLYVRELEPRSLARADLDTYDTIVIDSRALLRRREDLVPQIPRFLSYARRGNHLVVLYHKPQEFERNELGALLAPYPLELGQERITREDAPVEILAREHPHLTRPNKIEQRDWDAWFQERGLYFPARYDKRYVELVSMRELDVRGPEHAKRFEAQKSSLLAAEVGQGSYVYCALVLHRQLRKLHPGAARLLVNLVTPPKWRELR